MIYLAKDSNDLVSHCHCDHALVTFPPQADCPWCGCGWLFTCMECGKAFTFARAIEVSESWNSLAARALGRSNGDDPSPQELREWIEAMQELLQDVQLGERYVVFDGRFIPADQQTLNFDGWHATHRLAFVPQIAALSDSSVLRTILANEEYWQSHRIDE